MATVRWLAGLGLTLALGPVNAAAPDLQVRYDRAADRLSVHAERAPLSEVLKQVAARSGLEVLMDPAAEREVDVGFDALALEQGVKRIAGDLGTAMFYSRPAGDADAAPMLTTVHVLAPGTGEANLLPLLDPTGEIAVRAATSVRGTVTPGGVLDHARRRWEARVARMSPERQQSYLEQALEQQKRHDESEARRAAAIAEIHAGFEQREREREQRLQELKARDPERYELTIRREAEIVRALREGREPDIYSQ